MHTPTHTHLHPHTHTHTPTPTHPHTPPHTHTHTPDPLSALLQICNVQRTTGKLSDKSAVVFGTYYNLSLEVEDVLAYNPNNHARLDGKLQVPTLVEREFIFCSADLKQAKQAPATDSGSFLGAGFDCSCGCQLSFYFSMEDADDLVLRSFSGNKQVLRLHGRAKWMDAYESWSRGVGRFVPQLAGRFKDCDKTKQQLKSARRFVKPMQHWTPEYWQRIQVAYGLLCAGDSENTYKSFDFYSSAAYVGDRNELRVHSLTIADHAHDWATSTDLILELIRKGIIHNAVSNSATLREMAQFGTTARLLYEEQNSMYNNTDG